MTKKPHFWPQKTAVLAFFWQDLDPGNLSHLCPCGRIDFGWLLGLFICCLFLLFGIVCLFVCFSKAFWPLNDQKHNFWPKKACFASFWIGHVIVLFGKERAFGPSYKVMAIWVLFVLFCIVCLFVWLFKKGLSTQIIVWAAGPQLRANGPSIWPKARRRVIQSQKVAGAWRSQAPGSF